MQTRSSPNLQTLHRLAERISIEGYRNMPKTQLYLTLKSRCDVDRFLRLENRQAMNSSKCASVKRRRKHLYSPLALNIGLTSTEPKKAIRKEKLNKTDPIMLTQFRKGQKTFKFVRPNGTRVQFAIDSLVDYLLASGDFCDPETRIPFSDDDLTALDQLAEELKLGKPSVLAARHDQTKYNDLRFRRDALLGLERCAGEVITDMLELVEDPDADIEDVQVQMVTSCFPAFLDYFRQLRDAEPEYASKCLAHWRLFIAGPPNRPNRDDFGLLRAILHFLRSCEEGRL